MHPLPNFYQVFDVVLLFVGFWFCFAIRLYVCILDSDPSLDLWFATVFSHSIGCLFFFVFLLLCRNF